MKADDILNQIDEALDDWTSPDAMRSRPTPDLRPQVWLAPVGTEPDADGWEPIGYIVDSAEQVATIEIVPDIERLTAAFRALQQALQRVTVTFDASAWINTNDYPPEPEPQRPVRPRPPLPRRDGRPAWESPYGSARRRR